MTKVTRPSVKALDALLGKTLKVLDHGFVRLIDYMGDDESIVQAARVSYGRGGRNKRGDKRLIRYLMRHAHTTPFEMCEIKLHVKMPIFVARQWVRHRTASINEISARYSVVDDEFYMPAAQDLGRQSMTNKQGRELDIDAEDKHNLREKIDQHAKNSYACYQDMLDTGDGQGLARELARMVLPTNVYTQWYWKIDLHNLLHFVKLRSDSHAQLEIRAYADVIIESIIKPWVPITYEAFKDYHQAGHILNPRSMGALRRLFRGEKLSREKSRLDAEEWDELRALLGLEDTDHGKRQIEIDLPQERGNTGQRKRAFSAFSKGDKMTANRHRAEIDLLREEMNRCQTEVSLAEEGVKAIDKNLAKIDLLREEMNHRQTEVSLAEERAKAIDKNLAKIDLLRDEIKKHELSLLFVSDEVGETP